MEHAEAKARARRRPGGLHTTRHWIELDLPHPARSPPAWRETLSGLAGLAGWHCSNDIVGASQDARAEWRRGAAVLFNESPAGGVRADREGSRPRPDCGCHAKLGTQVLEVTASPRQQGPGQMLGCRSSHLVLPASS